ncbi:transposase [Kitasatospora sp. MAP12-15]|uniref:IS21 family transposase n=1 Tax=unclassified Kitasatospora TaxID=2633591 RepID=UPI0024756553|nr:IS21 family transposase [Kitasatospora sp. MAP12-44]MDH6115138.1 transposase [Kitasatospora sp. MAP12-44]
MVHRSREVLFERIRQAHREGLSGRELAARFKVSRNTVKQAIESPLPPKRKSPPPRASVLEPVKALIDAMLREDVDAPRKQKQKHTIVRIMERLAAEHDFELARQTTVWEYVSKRRPEIKSEALEGRRHLEGVVPQAKRPGEEAEVDFADFWLDLSGQRRKCVLFTLRLSYSGTAIHRVYATASQEAALEGHAEAFAVLGWVPSVHIRYDNLRPALKQVLFGRSRLESSRWASFKSCYQFSAFYCAPGEAGAHEKGGVEHEGGRFRRKHMVPPPRVDALAVLNERLAAIDVAEDARHIHGRPTSIGFDFEQERDLLRPLPADDFDCGIGLTPVVARNSRVTVRQGYYSVPAKFIGSKVRIKLRANELWVFDGRQVVARHPRLTRRYTYHDFLDHYLEILLVKPGAFAGASALAQARAEVSFTKGHEAFWAAAKQKVGDREGTRMLIEVLLLHRQLPAAALVQGVATCLRIGSVSTDLVAIEARPPRKPSPRPPLNDQRRPGDPTSWFRPHQTSRIRAENSDRPLLRVRPTRPFPA